MLLIFFGFALVPVIFLLCSSRIPGKIVLALSLIWAIILFNFSLLLFVNYNHMVGGAIQGTDVPVLFTVEQRTWVTSPIFSYVQPLDGLFGYDGLSLFFLLLTTFLLPPSILYSFNYIEDKSLNFYLALLFTLNFILILFFTTYNILIFYILFELTLLPIFILIIFWGSKARKTLAAFYFFLYTFFGSLFFLFAIFFLYFYLGTLNLFLLTNYDYPFFIQRLLWPCIALGLLIKIPMFPFHLWLVEAHVEAPTIGSVYLASILLKLGSYGFLRILVPIFPYGTTYYISGFQTLALLSLLYCSFIIIRQTDLKRIIAYSSIIHMNMAMYGLATLNAFGVQGCFLSVIAHGLTSGALFILVGCLYDRFKTRSVFYLSGVCTLMPVFGLFFIFFIFCNVSFPGTINFVSEILLIMGVLSFGYLTNATLGPLLFCSALFSSALYSCWLMNRVLFSQPRTLSFWKHYFTLKPIFYYDLTEREILVLMPFCLYSIIFGIYPFLLQYSFASVQRVIALFLL